MRGPQEHQTSFFCNPQFANENRKVAKTDATQTRNFYIFKKKGKRTQPKRNIPTASIPTILAWVFLENYINTRAQGQLREKFRLLTGEAPPST